MSALKGEFVWADVQLGPSQVSALRNSEVSAFQGLIYAIIYGDNSVPEQTVRKNEVSAFQGFGIYSGVPLYTVLCCTINLM